MSAPWLNSLTSKRVDTLYLAVVVATFVLGGVMALFLHSELIAAGDTLLTPDEFGRFITAHGLLMVFLFLVPAVPAVLGNYALPRLLGADDTAQPALGALSFVLYALGAAATVAAALAGGLDGGWDFFAVFRPDAAPGLAETLLTLGVALTAASMVCNGVNFISTIHRLRPASMGLYDLPVFAWTLYATAVVHILATAALAVVVTIISADAKFAGGLVDPDAGGDPLLPQRWFWLFAHPFVYASVLPAIGVISEALGRFARKRVFA
ncbi:cbb3-type cytochrome c oxidase subunit I, partial [bacterium]|nr:cbb3-type cytochrome c oxidase subunit I [bacterium]